MDSKKGSRSKDDCDDGYMSALEKIFAQRLKLGSQKVKSTEQVLSEVSFQGVVDYIKSGKCKNIIAMVGAGISTSAGIPDFRSPVCGLYHNLEKYNLPAPECMFEISYFKENPEPFFNLAKELFPGEFKPTLCHYFLKLLEEKKILSRLYTQNIDTLERISGLSEDKLVEAHGSFFISHCLKSSCRKSYSLDWMKEKIFAEEIPSCENCKSLVKPDIVFFGESLPDRFSECVSKDFPKCDFLLIIGTSLTVQPFASLVEEVPPSTPRLLINLEKCGEGSIDGLDFNSASNTRDVAWLGLCDEGCQKLADAIGWGDELKNMVKEEHSKIEENSKRSKDTVKNERSKLWL